MNTNFQILIGLFLLMVTLGESRPGGVSQVGFSIYRNKEEALAHSKNPLIVTYSIAHPNSQDDHNGAQVLSNPDDSHQFHHHALHQQQMEFFRRTQQQRQPEGPSTFPKIQYNDQYKPAVRRDPVPVPVTVPTYQNVKFQQKIKAQVPTDKIVIDSVALPLPKNVRNSGIEKGQAVKSTLDLNELLSTDGNYPVQYY